MKYLSEINAFYDWLETNTLATSDIVVWHALMHICNKAGWPRHFTVAMDVMKVKTGLKRDTLYECRNRLRNAGRIRWDSRKGNQSAIYEIIPFVSDISTQTPTQSPTQTPIQTPKQLPTQTPTINRLEENTAEKNDDEFSQVVKGVSDVMGRVILSPFEAEQIGMWLNEYHFPLVMEAVRQSGLNGAAKPMPYIDTILLDWGKRGITTVAAAKEAAQQKQLIARPGGKKKKENWRDLLPKREEM